MGPNHMPHGRGINIDYQGTINIQYWSNGSIEPGISISVFKSGKTMMGKSRVDGDGVMSFYSSKILKPDGTEVSYGESCSIL